MAFTLTQAHSGLHSEASKCHLTQGLQLLHWDSQQEKNERVERVGSPKGLAEGSKKLSGANKDLLESRKTAQRSCGPSE